MNEKSEQHDNKSVAEGERKDETHQAQVIKHPRAPMVMGKQGFEFDFDSAWRFARGLIEGGMVPKGIVNPGAVVGLIEAGKELGLAPMYALANLTFTNGRLGIMGDAAKALIRSKGGLEPGTDFTEEYTGEEYTPEWKCTVTAHRRGSSAPVSRSFSIADAIKAKLIRLDGTKVSSRKGSEWIDYGPWSTYTKRMLMYRAFGFLARDYFSDYLGGAVLAEELRDYPTQDREVVPPSEPDPLLQNAPKASAPVAVVEAEVVKEPAPKPTEVKAAAETDDRDLVREIEKLEGRVLTADNLEELNSAWRSSSELLTRIPPAEAKRLKKLYDQIKRNF